MDRLAFTAAAAITEQTVSRQQIVHELANVSTVGFKRSYELALRAVAAEGSGFETRIQPQAIAIDRIQLGGGSVMATGRKLDLAMNHQTVLGVTAADGTLAFTRRGDVRVNAQGTLEIGDGKLVRGANNSPISVPVGLEISITPDGTVFAKDPAQGPEVPARQVGRLLLRDASSTPLSRRQDGLFNPEGKPLGTDIQDGNVLPSVTTGALEGSNVVAIESMVKLIDHSRSFEQQINIIKESKQIDESGATMLRVSS